MRKTLGISILIGIIVALEYIALPSKTPSINSPEITPTLQPQEDQVVNIKATFTVMTDKITRSFINPKYHNRSNDVFITADDPSIIYVKKEGITWQDFFDTLPMKLTKDCLITGDSETLCNDKGTLTFSLNDEEDNDLLTREIKDSNKLLVKYISN